MLNVHLVKALPEFTVDVQLQIGKGEIGVLFGPSGSGKTTCLQLIAGLIQPTKGMISLGETQYYVENQKPFPPEKRKIGYVMQDYALFPHMTVIKNIQYGMNSTNQDERNELAQALLAQFNIEHLESAYPHEISGGEKQRVAIARALATKPELLLLDEPLSALDDHARESALSVIQEVQQSLNIPILMVTHHRKEAEKIASRIYFIEKGRLI